MKKRGNKADIKRRVKRKRYLTYDEEKALLAAAADAWRTRIVFAIETGLRKRGAVFAPAPRPRHEGRFRQGARGYRQEREGSQGSADQPRRKGGSRDDVRKLPFLCAQRETVSASPKTALISSNLSGEQPTPPASTISIGMTSGGHAASAVFAITATVWRRSSFGWAMTTSV